MSSPTLYRAGTLTYTRPQLVILFFWLLWGDFCYMLMETVVPTIMPLKFKELGASNTSVGLIMITIPMILNSFINPIVSFKSDRYRSRWGRRIPFIIFTLPLLVLFLIGIGFGDKIGIAIFPYVSKITTRFTPNQVAIGVIGLMMTFFSVFNSFVNAVFWYLFNDVIPEQLLARFMSWFRVVSMLSASVYGFFIMPFAESHMLHIFIGAAILYTFGFGLMCFCVKEGQYPPPPAYVDGQSGPIAAFKTYGKECFSILHYWYLFAVGICMGSLAAMGVFTIYFNQTIGLDLTQIGRLSGIFAIIGGVFILLSGWLADRYHPVRITMIGFTLNALLIPLNLIWLFWHPNSQTVFFMCVLINFILAPISAFVGVLDPPLFMRIFPRERYGQYCSANALCRSLAMIFMGTLAGVYLDVLTNFFGRDTAYRLIPVWNLFFTATAAFFLFKLYQSWKKYGGDETYVPPSIETKGEPAPEKPLATSTAP